MSTKELTEGMKNTVISSLEDIKAIDVAVLPVSELTSLADYMIVATGSSDRHVKAIANIVTQALKKNGYKVRAQGEADADWILLDAGDVIVHVMIPSARAYYNIEGLWQ